MVDINDMWDDEEDLAMVKNILGHQDNGEDSVDSKDWSIYESYEISVALSDSGDVGFCGYVSRGGYECCPPSQAIAAARAILKHFGKGLED